VSDAGRLGPPRKGLKAARALGGEDLSTRLARWAADARADDAVAARARQQWLRRQAEEDATTAGLLVDLAERGEPVSLALRGGRECRGVVVTVGTDFCAVRRPSDDDALVPFAALAAIRVDGTRTAMTARRSGVVLRLSDALAALVPERPDILVATDGNEPWRGELRAVGWDVLSMRVDELGPRSLHVPLAAIVEVVLTTARG
jgi:hypothetical protein